MRSSIGLIKTFALLLAVAFLALGTSPPALAQEADLDDVLGGFEEERDEESFDPLDGFDEEETARGPSDRTPARKPYHFGGSAALKSAYNYAHQAPEQGATDYRGISRLRAELNLGLDFRLLHGIKGRISGRGFYDAVYALRGEDDYTDETLEAYRSEAELSEAWLQGSIFESLDLKVGRQVLAWGKSDNVRVTDVINPLDNREPGLVDIEDLRLPVAMTRFDYYAGPFSVTAAAIHERRFSKRPTYGSDFWPYPFPAPEEDIPDNSVENTEYAVAIEGRFSGWDMAFYYADIYDDTPYIEVTGFRRQPRQRPTPILVMRHARIAVTGLAANVAVGSWLLKGEVAYTDGLRYSALPNQDFARLDLMAGLEYAGFTDTNLALEVTQRTIQEYDPRLSARKGPQATPEEEVQMTARITRTFMRELLQAAAVASMFGWEGEGGGFARLQLGYDITDRWQVIGGAIFYRSGDLPMLSNIGDNDRVFLDLTYSF